VLRCGIAMSLFGNSPRAPNLQEREGKGSCKIGWLAGDTDRAVCLERCVRCHGAKLRFWSKVVVGSTAHGEFLGLAQGTRNCGDVFQSPPQMTLLSMVWSSTAASLHGFMLRWRGLFTSSIFGIEKRYPTEWWMRRYRTDAVR